MDDSDFSDLSAAEIEFLGELFERLGRHATWDFRFEYTQDEVVKSLNAKKYIEVELGNAPGRVTVSLAPKGALFSYDKVGLAALKAAKEGYRRDKLEHDHQESNRLERQTRERQQHEIEVARAGNPGKDAWIGPVVAASVSLSTAVFAGLTGGAFPAWAVLALVAIAGAAVGWAARVLYGRWRSKA